MRRSPPGLLLALAVSACGVNKEPAPVVDHGRPMMTQQALSNAATTTLIDAPPANAVPLAAPVPRVDIQALRSDVPAVAEAARPDVAARPAQRDAPAAQAGPTSPRIVIRSKPPRATRSAPTPQQRPNATPARSRPPVEPPPRDSAGFLMPVIGRVVSEFGSKPNGLVNDGINIAAARGTPVRASEAGVVAYAGEEIRGFGRLLLLRHADGYVTAYAHNDKLLVKRGEIVARGQVISTVGASGGINAPQLHFEIRKGARPLDPRRLLADDRDTISPINAAQAARPGPG